MGKRLLTVFGLIALVIIIDQWTKYWALNTLQGDPNLPYEYLGGLFQFTFARNDGAFLSLGSDLSKNLRFITLTILPVLVLLFLLYQTLFSKQLPKWHIVAFSLILGGGFSNIYDRIVYESVVDFMLMEAFGLRTGIFNIADNAIMAGLFIILPSMFKSNKPKEKPEEQAES